MCAFLEKFAPGHFHFNVISFKFIVNGNLCFAFAAAAVAQQLRHDRSPRQRFECSGMFMHAARFLDLSCCCRLNANGTFFDFDSKNEWPRQAAFDDLLLPIAHCPFWLPQIGSCCT